MVVVTISTTCQKHNHISQICVRKLDLLHLCFSLNFLFSYVLSKFPSMSLLLTYSQLLIFLSVDYLRHSR